jgi:hypothetical protein
MVKVEGWLVADARSAAVGGERKRVVLGGLCVYALPSFVACSSVSGYMNTQYCNNKQYHMVQMRTPPALEIQRSSTSSSEQAFQRKNRKQQKKREKTYTDYPTKQRISNYMLVFLMPRTKHSMAAV